MPMELNSTLLAKIWWCQSWNRVFEIALYENWGKHTTSNPINIT